MDKYNYAIFDGAIYKKAPDAFFTYVHCSSVSDFLHHILGNSEIAEQISVHMVPLVSLLSVKSCRLIKPICVDFNFIEVQPKCVCFNIKLKKFEKNPKDLKGL